MIKTVELKNLELAPCPWMKNLETFKKQTKFEFTPGLNILWAPNGKGKSSLLTLLSKLFLCEQGQTEQKFTSSSRLDLFHYGRPNAYEGVAIEHDGSPVIYCPGGTLKGKALAGHFDDDFFMESVQSHMFRGSSGETALVQINTILDTILKSKYKPVNYGNCSPENLSVLEKFFAGTLPKDKPTALFDEPDKSLDIINQVLVWAAIKKVAKLPNSPQIIVATHNIIACDIEGANYISLGDEHYLNICRAVRKEINEESLTSTGRIQKIVKDCLKPPAEPTPEPEPAPKPKKTRKKAHEGNIG